MADPEHVEQLAKGVESWNHWRMRNQRIKVDLSDLDFQRFGMTNSDTIDFEIAMYHAPGINLVGADLRRAKLGRKWLLFADFMNANLTGADLTQTYLIGCSFWGTNLSDASLVGANLEDVRFSATTVAGADFARARLLNTQFTRVDLGRAINLDQVKHEGPSFLSIETLLMSCERLPDGFLAGCGIPTDVLEYLPSLMTTPLQFHSCFISYSAVDTAFVNRLHADLRRDGVRCWLASRDMRIGDPIRRALDSTIHTFDKLLLVLSAASLESQWVEQEVETALERERNEGRTLVFPVAIDRAVWSVQSGWPRYIRNTRNIGMYDNWKSPSEYEAAYRRLLRDLRQPPPTDLPVKVTPDGAA